MVKIEIEQGIFFLRYYNILLCGDDKYVSPISGRRRGRRQGWEKEKKRETGMGEKDRKRGKSGRERKIGRETGVGAREREIQGRKRERQGETGERESEIQGRKRGRDGEKERDRQWRKREGGRKKKITNTKKFMEFYLVVLQSGYPYYVI